MVFVPLGPVRDASCPEGASAVLQEQQHGTSCEHYSAATLISGPDLSADFTPLQPSSGQRNQLGSRDTASVHTPGSKA